MNPSLSAKPPAPPAISVNFQIPAAIHRKLKADAALRGMTLSGLIVARLANTVSNPSQESKP